MYKGKRKYRLALVSVLLLGAVAAAVLVLVDPLGRTLKEVTLPLRHDDVIRQQAKEKDLDPALIAAVIYGESRFRPRKSKAGAVGLMQIMPDTARFIAKKSGGIWSTRENGSPLERALARHLSTLVCPAL